MSKLIPADVKLRVMKAYYLDGMLPKDIAVQESISDTSASKIICTAAPTEFGKPFIDRVLAFMNRNTCTPEYASMRFHVPVAAVEKWSREQSIQAPQTVDEVMKPTTISGKVKDERRQELGNALLQVCFAFQKLANAVMKSI